MWFSLIRKASSERMDSGCVLEVVKDKSLVVYNGGHTSGLGLNGFVYLLNTWQYSEPSKVQYVGLQLHTRGWRQTYCHAPTHNVVPSKQPLTDDMP